MSMRVAAIDHHFGRFLGRYKTSNSILSVDLFMELLLDSKTDTELPANDVLLFNQTTVSTVDPILGGQKRKSRFHSDGMEFQNW